MWSFCKASGAPRSPHKPGQKEDRPRKDYDNHQARQIGDEKRRDALEDRLERRARQHGFDDKHVEPDGRRDQADLDDHHHGDAKPD